MNITKFLTCPCCDEKILVTYDDTYGLSIDSAFLSQKLQERIQEGQQNLTMLRQLEQIKSIKYTN